MGAWSTIITCMLPFLSTTFAQTPTPNIIIIIADDLGYGDLSCYDPSKFHTPNIDKLAGQGVRFSHGYAPFPFCAPSRATLLTGRYPFRHGLEANPVPSADPVTKNADHLGLDPSEITLARLLKMHGYATCAIGKWHLGHRPEFWPTRHGFDHYYGIPYSNDMHPVRLYEDDNMVEYPVVQATLTRRYTQRALDFIRAHKSKPFFLYLAHAMPHKPLACSEEFYRKTGKGLYADVLAELDWSCGQITQELSRLGLDQQTLLVFTSDNGPWYGGNTGGLRGMKGQTWEGGVRVPLILRMPASDPAGKVLDEPVMLGDIFTTCLSLARIKPPSDRIIDGQDLWPLIREGRKLEREAVYVFRGPQLMAVRQGKWKLHVAPPQPPKWKLYKPGENYSDPRGPDGIRILAPYEQAHPSQLPGLVSGDVVTSMALFDLEKDPAEQTNVIEKYPETVQQLHRLAQRIRMEMQQEATRRSR
ncbi:MAG: sulfatase [Gemmatales bacterium]|nr:sulfatase [Gemmatales bacterium]MDW8176388.1 sulfatase [Gemmatales bacterium]